MYSGTVTLPTAPATSQSLRDLVNAAISGEIPSNAAVTGATFGGPPPNSGFDGRCVLVVLSVPTGSTSVNICSRAGINSGNNLVALPVGTILNLSAVTGNQISIDEIFLYGGAAGQTVGVEIFVA